MPECFLVYVITAYAKGISAKPYCIFGGLKNSPDKGRGQAVGIERVIFEKGKAVGAGIKHTDSGTEGPEPEHARPVFKNAIHRIF